MLTVSALALAETVTTRLKPTCHPAAVLNARARNRLTQCELRGERPSGFPYLRNARIATAVSTAAQAPLPPQPTYFSDASTPGRRAAFWCLSVTWHTHDAFYLLPQTCGAIPVEPLIHTRVLRNALRDALSQT